MELADSWQDWINWKYLGYHGPINPRYADTSSLEARYLAPSGSGPINSVTTNVAVNAATSTTESLQASITSGWASGDKGYSALPAGWPIARYGRRNSERSGNPGSKSTIWRHFVCP